MTLAELKEELRAFTAIGSVGPDWNDLASTAIGNRALLEETSLVRALERLRPPALNLLATTTLAPAIKALGVISASSLLANADTSGLGSLDTSALTPKVDTSALMGQVDTSASMPKVKPRLTVGGLIPNV